MQFTLYSVRASGSRHSKWKVKEITQTSGALCPAGDVVNLPGIATVEDELKAYVLSQPNNEISQVWVCWQCANGDVVIHRLEDTPSFDNAAEWAVHTGFEGIIYDGVWVTRRYFKTDPNLRRYLKRACPDYLPETLKYQPSQY